jgi:hypothetical protein
MGHGGTGSVPAVLGRPALGSIGITNDESKANVLMVRGDKHDAVKKDPRAKGSCSPAIQPVITRFRPASRSGASPRPTFSS